MSRQSLTRQLTRQLPGMNDNAFDYPIGNDQSHRRSLDLQPCALQTHGVIGQLGVMAEIIAVIGARIDESPALIGSESMIQRRLGPLAEGLPALLAIIAIDNGDPPSVLQDRGQPARRRESFQFHGAAEGESGEFLSQAHKDGEQADSYGQEHPRPPWRCCYRSVLPPQAGQTQIPERSDPWRYGDRTEAST